MFNSWQFMFSKINPINLWSLKSLQVRDVQRILVSRLPVLILPCAMLPESLDDIGHTLLELRIAVLRGQLAHHLPIEGVTTAFHRDATTLEIFGGTVLLLVLAFREMANVNNRY